VDCILNARVASLKLMRWVIGSQCNDFSRGCACQDLCMSMTKLNPNVNNINVNLSVITWKLAHNYCYLQIEN